MIESYLRRVATAAGEPALWAALCRLARRRGFEPRELGRVRTYLRSSLGLEAPRYADPAQRPEHYFPRPAGQAWHTTTDHPWMAELAGAHEVIRAEFEAVETRVRRQAPEVTEGGPWGVYYLQHMGKRVEENCRQCPKTAQVLDGLADARGTGHVYFSLLAPGTHIKPHCGPINVWLRCHLGLRVPSGCRIRVGSETKTMAAGRCLVFDDAFEHEVWNPSGETRAVLVFDFWHPDLSDAEAWALWQIIRMSAVVRRLDRAVVDRRGGAGAQALGIATP